MRAYLANSGALATAAMLAFGVISVRAQEGKIRDRSAAELVHFLTDPIDPLQWPDPLDRSPARAEANRAAANSLVALGSKAMGDLDMAFDEIERRGEESPLARNAKWLLLAYATIRGPESYQRLRAMIDNPRLRFLDRDLDNSLAVALGLTSYVSAARLDYPFVCCEEPRQSLDRLILAWMQGDRLSMEGELGSSARLALGLLLANRSWPDMRAEVWQGVPGPESAVGFRFENPGDWSRPEDTLDKALRDRRRTVHLDKIPKQPRLVTEFVDRAGNDCTRLEIRFVEVPTDRGSILVKYVVDERDLEGLLRTISRCALRLP